MSASQKTKREPSRILLVDDNEHGNIARKTLLEAEGFEVEACLRPEEALELFSERPFDLVVTDFRMPAMNGVELIARLKQSRPVQTILLSGFVACLGLTEKETGADAVIMKSNNEADLLRRTVRNLLTSRRKPPGREKGNGSPASAVARSG